MISVKQNFLASGWSVVATSSAPPPPLDAPSNFAMPPLVIPTLII